MLQVDHIGSQILSKLLRDWKLMDELGVLRDVYLLGSGIPCLKASCATSIIIALRNFERFVILMESGDLLQHFLTVVFQKLDKGESWDDDFELNTVLQVHVCCLKKACIILNNDMMSRF